MAYIDIRLGGSLAGGYCRHPSTLPFPFSTQNSGLTGQNICRIVPRPGVRPVRRRFWKKSTLPIVAYISRTQRARPRILGPSPARRRERKVPTTRPLHFSLSEARACGESSLFFRTRQKNFGLHVRVLLGTREATDNSRPNPRLACCPLRGPLAYSRADCRRRHRAEKGESLGDFPSNAPAQPACAPPAVA